MPGRIGKHEAVDHIAVLANEVEKRGQVGRKQQYKPTQLNFRRMSGFGPNASTLRQGTEANRHAHGCYKSTTT